jgi:hypothetical protein
MLVLSFAPAASLLIVDVVGWVVLMVFAFRESPRA